MSEHTPTPWYINVASGPTQIAAVSPFVDIGVCFVPSDARKLNVGKDNAAFIVKACNNHENLLEFFKWAMREGPWDGCDLDGAAIQDKAEELGLIVKTQYDAEKHGVQSDFETGDDWFEYAPDLRAPLIRPGTT